MNILIFGSDSTAHVLAWKLVNSTYVDEVILAPGNGGTNFFARSTTLTPNDPGAVANFVLSESLDLVVADHTAMLAGLPDELRALQLPIVGASRACVTVSHSRCATREWLQQHGLPLPRGRVCATQGEAEKFAATLGLPLLVAADARDGSLIPCTDRAAVPQAIADCFTASESAGIVIEELVPGPLVTASILTDGTHAIPVPATRLYPAADSEQGADVWRAGRGWLGAHSAATPLWTRLETFLDRQVRQPLIKALRADGWGVNGWIGTTCVVGQRGLVVRSLHLAPSGLELATTLPRLSSDLVPLLIGCARGSLAAAEPAQWTATAVVGVALLRITSTDSDGEITPSAFEMFEPGVLVYHHRTTPNIPNTYVAKSARQTGTRPRYPSLPTSTHPAHSAIAGAADPTVGIVVARAPNIATARDQVYANLRRAQLVNITYSDHVGSQEL